MKSKIQLIFSIFLLSFVYAHKPLEDNVKSSDYRNALKIENPDVSYVVYHEVSDSHPRIWLRLEAEKDYRLYISLGVPVINRLKNYRPAVALVGPGLPESKLPFKIPPSSGAILFETDSIINPEFFHEPITNTDSWIYIKKWITLPQSGTYYIVGYHPKDEPGKLWVAPGTKEQWGIGDIFRLPSIIKPVRQFHEVY
ncbi:hypothetical protein GX441_05210 [bacterium]|nr:hypothetical protein [bacterium]